MTRSIVTNAHSGRRGARLPDVRKVPILGRIVAVVYTVLDVGAIESEYTRWLGSRVAARGSALLRSVTEPLAARWQTFTTFGRNVSEIVVEDVDAHARTAVGRVFIVVAGAPDVAGMLDTYVPFANETDPQ